METSTFGRPNDIDASRELFVVKGVGMVVETQAGDQPAPLAEIPIRLRTAEAGQ